LLHSDFWCLFTDGEVTDTEIIRLHQAAKNNGALTIPVIILVTACQPVSAANLSVGIALYANGSDAMFLYKRIGKSPQDTRIYVISAKGRFAPLRPNTSGDGSDNDYPIFPNEKAFWDECAAKSIKVTRAEDRSRDLETPGIAIGTTTNEAGATVQITLNIETLVQKPSITPSDLDLIIAPETFKEVALAARTQGQTEAMRIFLEQQRPQTEIAELQDIYGAGKLIARANRQSKSSHSQADVAERARIREAHSHNRVAYHTQAGEAIRRDEAIDAAIDTLSYIKGSKYDATLFTSRPTTFPIAPNNRSRRQVHISRLSFNAPNYSTQCQICCEAKAMMSLAVKKLEPHTITSNQSQGAATSPLLYGKWTTDTSPFSSQIICYQCAKALMPRSIYKEDLSSIIPVTQYEGDNKEIINKAVYDALTGGHCVGEVQLVQMAMALLGRSMAAVSWIAGDATKRAIFEWLLMAILNNSKVPARFNPGSQLVSYRQALHWIVEDCNNIGAKSYVAQMPSEALVVVVSLGQRSRSFTGESCKTLASARILRLIIETFLSLHSNSGGRPWQEPWQRLASQTSNSGFWRGLRLIVDLNSLQGIHEESRDSFLRYRTIIYLLNFRNGQSTVANFVDHIEHIGGVLINLKHSMHGSWIDLDPSSLPAATSHVSLSSPPYAANPQTTYPYSSGLSSASTSYQYPATSTSSGYSDAQPTYATSSGSASTYNTSNLQSSADNSDLYEDPVAGMPESVSSTETYINDPQTTAASQQSAASDWVWSAEYGRYYRLLPSGAYEWAAPSQ
jgi:hypothetical protein